MRCSLRTASDMACLDGAGLLRLRGLRAIRWIGIAGSELVEHLMRGVLALAEGREQVGGGGDAVFVGDAARSWSSIWLMGTLNLRASRSSSLRPISTARRRWSSLSQCLILLRARGLLTKVSQSRLGLWSFCVTISTMSPVRSLVRKRHHAAVDLGADAGVADLGVNGVGEVDGRAVGGNHNDLSFGREGVDLVGIEVHLQAGEEFVGVGHLLLPLDELADPVEALFVARGDDAVLALYFQCAAIPSSAMRCISSVRICTSN